MGAIISAISGALVFLKDGARSLLNSVVDLMKSLLDKLKALFSWKSDDEVLMKIKGIGTYKNGNTTLKMEGGKATIIRKNKKTVSVAVGSTLKDLGGAITDLGDKIDDPNASEQDTQKAYETMQSQSAQAKKNFELIANALPQSVN
uniref:Uncharacterized protein n=1 Tax=Vannella robusta TaxID=1487602 RepID=A0A6U1W7B2_9EUKA|mmetsp:Transcript_25872/g.33005  ORF Transcript_25872/g.33005 Transcript_25872/m.33005 type:complete len:146 (+) Transcript_25872:920-1357(+)